MVLHYDYDYDYVACNYRHLSVAACVPRMHAIFNVPAALLASSWRIYYERVYGRDFVRELDPVRDFPWRTDRAAILYTEHLQAANLTALSDPSNLLQCEPMTHWRPLGVVFPRVPASVSRPPIQDGTTIEVSRCRENRGLADNVSCRVWSPNAPAAQQCQFVRRCDSSKLHQDAAACRGSCYLGKTHKPCRHTGTQCHQSSQTQECSEVTAAFMYHRPGSGIYYHVGRTAQTVSPPTAAQACNLTCPVSSSNPCTHPRVLEAVYKCYRAQGYDTLVFKHHQERACGMDGTGTEVVALRGDGQRCDGGLKLRRGWLGQAGAFRGCEECTAAT